MHSDYYFQIPSPQFLIANVFLTLMSFFKFILRLTQFNYGLFCDQKFETINWILVVQDYFMILMPASCLEDDISQLPPCLLALTFIQLLVHNVH